MLIKGCMPHRTNKLSSYAEPKIYAPSKVTNFRPISVYNTLYKVILKILSHATFQAELARMSSTDRIDPSRATLLFTLADFACQACIFVPLKKKDKTSLEEEINGCQGL